MPARPSRPDEQGCSGSSRAVDSGVIIANGLVKVDALGSHSGTFQIDVSATRLFRNQRQELSSRLPRSVRSGERTRKSKAVLCAVRPIVQRGLKVEDGVGRFSGQILLAASAPLDCQRSAIVPIEIDKQPSEPNRWDD